MPIRNPMNDHPMSASEPDAAGESGATLAGHADPRKGRGRRPRFGDVTAETQLRVETGAIAISFAVVSRRHWPR